MATTARGRRSRATAAAHAADDAAAAAAAPDRLRSDKRLRNRLAQQSTRQKQAARIRQLEHFVDNIQALSASPRDSQTQTQRMQLRLLELMRENQELREGILRMRKKLLSLSSVAQCGAGTCFGHLLSPARPRCILFVLPSFLHTHSQHSHVSRTPPFT
jgi:hypothetical protein